MRSRLAGLVAALLSVASGVSAGAMAGVGVVPAMAAGGAWTMYHLDSARNGNDANDPSLSVVAERWSSPPLDSRVYGEPLVVNNVVYAGTRRNTVYALDLGDGHVLWSVSLGAAVPLSAVQATANVPGCGNVDPLGITGTPVIDPSRGTAGTLFVAAETWDGARGSTIEHRLYAVDLSSHAVTSANADPVGYSDGAHRALEQERGALALSGGKVAVPYGGLIGDCGAYRGALVSLSEDLTGSHTWLADPNSTRGGIWSTAGAAADRAGNFYVTTGNGNEPSNAYNYSDGVIKLSPSMGLLDYFAPASWHSDNIADLDLGSMGPVLIPRAPGGTLVFATGKQHTGFLLDSGSLGHVGHELFSATVCDGEAKGGAAYRAPYLYVPCSEGLRALLVDTAATPPTFRRAWRGPPDSSGSPILAGGSVWVHGSGVLYALNPATGGVAQAISGVSTPYNFASAAAAAGTLLFPSDNVIRAFGNTCTSGGGYQLDGWGGIHPYCGAAVLTGQDGYWQNWDIARGIAERSDHRSGYVLDGWGGVHEFSAGTMPAHVGDGKHAYWPGWDIARGIVLDPCDPAGESGYVLDGWGGIHDFSAGGYHPPVFKDGSHAYWSGWDIARGIAMNPCSGGAGSEGGYVVDGYGGVHAFGMATPVCDSCHAYWQGFDIARGLVVTSGNGGYTLDGWGGIHRFGTESHVVADTTHAYWPGWNIARGIVSTGAGQGYTLDGWGGIHDFGGARVPTGGGYWPGWDIAKGMT